jgi:hypothetical protein
MESLTKNGLFHGKLHKLKRKLAQLSLELFKRELPPSLEQQFWLAYQMQRRISDKPIGRFEDWRSSVVHINSKDFATTNFTQPEASTELS